MTQSSSVHQEETGPQVAGLRCVEHPGSMWAWAQAPGPRAADLGKEAAEPPGGLDVKLSQWPQHTEDLPSPTLPPFLASR